MVSIENRIVYMERINQSPKLKAFHHFLLDKEITSLPNSDVNDLDEQFFKILSSIQTNNKIMFEEVYAQISKRNPSKDSPAPFVNDDYLIFCLIIGICKFDIEKSWIKNILSIRSRNITTITFENILNENYSSNSNLAEVVLMFLHLCKLTTIINNNLLNTAYRSITTNVDLFESKNDFQVLCAIRAYDLIIEQKEANEGIEISMLKNFNEKFQTRIKILSWILQAAFFFGLIFGLFKLPIYSPETIAFLDKYDFVFSFLGFLGFPFIGNQIPIFKNKSQELIMRLFGYPKELIKKQY